MKELLPHCCAARLSAAQIRSRARDLTREYADNGARRIALSDICRRYDVPLVDALRILARAQASEGWRSVRFVDDGRYGPAAEPRRAPEEDVSLSRKEVAFLLNGPGAGSK